MVESPGRETDAGHGVRKLGGALTLHVIAPLGVFCGLRFLGIGQFVALLAGAVLPAAGALREIAGRRRVSGVHLFVLATKALTVAMSFPHRQPARTADPQLLGHGGARSVDRGRPPQQATLPVRSHQDRPRRGQAADLAAELGGVPRLPAAALWVCSAFWAVACLVDTAVRIAMAATLPIDLVPLLDDGLLAVTLAVVLAFQRLYGRSYMRRHGLRIRGVRISALAGPSTEPG